MTDSTDDVDFYNGDSYFDLFGSKEDENLYLKGMNKMSNVTVEQKVVRVEGVNPKSKYPKFNSGSILTVDGEWLNVAKKVDIRQFQRGNAYTLDVETNEKGYQTVVGVSNPEREIKTNGKAESAKQDTGDTKSYQDKYDAKDKRIQRSGLIQASVQSLFVTDFDSAVELAEKMLEWVNK